MGKKVFLVFLSIFCISMFTYGVDAWIRINQLGYLPNSQKKAVMISESALTIKQFTINDALTNQELGTFNTIISKGEFQNFKSTYILDFSSFKQQGAFYIQAGLIYSPTIYINKNVYLGTADYLLNYLRLQRNDYYPDIVSDNQQYGTYEVTGDDFKPKKEPENNSNFLSSIYSNSKSFSRNSKKKFKSEYTDTPSAKFLDVRGGWHEATNFTQYGSTASSAIYQMLFAYQMNPGIFCDTHNSKGNNNPNGIPDILDEAKWGLDWLLKMNPFNDVLYHQISDDFDQGDNNEYNEPQRPVFQATGKPQGFLDNKNHSNGIASIAGKYSSAFSLGAELLAKYYPDYADSLKTKALDAYEFGKKNPGVCQSVPDKSNNFFVEENWTDDMELAAAQLYRLTYNGDFLKEATDYGRMEPVSPWMCTDTVQYYQWFPFINLGHYVLANVENPRFNSEFSLNMLNGIQRMNFYATKNPFNVGVPMVKSSNNMVTALATQCRLYRTMTNDSTYLNMENSLIDWIFGLNPWGKSMVVGMPASGDYPVETHSKIWNDIHIPPFGGLVNGPVNSNTFKTSSITRFSKENENDPFQSDWAVYNDDYDDYLTNEPTIDGTAALTYLLSSKQMEGMPDKTIDYNEYSMGGINRTDSTKKQISLIFTGNEYNDGYKIILSTLNKLNIKASFFFTGKFYDDSKNRQIITKLQKEKFYIGANSNDNSAYCSLQNPDSLAVDKSEFLNDLKANYKAMEKFGIYKSQTPFFVPPKECYNAKISQWCKEVGLKLISSTPGTLSKEDITTPVMRNKYFSSNEIYKRILQIESQKGLNGYILLFHLGSDKRRKDKFYTRLESLLSKLTKEDYEFVDLYKATDTDENKSTITVKNKKRKN